MDRLERIKELKKVISQGYKSIEKGNISTSHKRCLKANLEIYICDLYSLYLEKKAELVELGSCKLAVEKDRNKRKILRNFQNWLFVSQPKSINRKEARNEFFEKLVLQSYDMRFPAEILEVIDDDLVYELCYLIEQLRFSKIMYLTL